LGDRIRYVFRHIPIAGSDLARPAAVLAEQAPDEERFWDAHMALMTRSDSLREEDLQVVAEELGIDRAADTAAAAEAARRVDEDVQSARASGVIFTPTFFINGRRYEGLWDETSFGDALLGSLGHRVRTAALDFARWAPSAGLLLLLATLVAVGLTNSPLGPRFTSFWENEVGITFGGAGFQMSLLHWINDGLLTVFFLVVGLEIKREFTVGHLSSRRSAALPIAAAIGGMAVPVLLFQLVIPTGAWSHGWGVPMATDTAFAVAIIAMMGSRVPVDLRIFLTAAAIVDDIGAIFVVALFYSGGIQITYLLAAGAVVVGLAMLNRLGIYNVTPYMILGLALWATLLASGLHATLAGVLLAMLIPTRPPANLQALMTQADAILISEARRSNEVLRTGPSEPALEMLDAIHDRLESPADRTLRTLSVRSSYVVLPLFALANAGVALDPAVVEGRQALMLAIMAGLVLGKPLGLFGASALAVRLGIATKPDAYGWRQLLGAGALAGIGFTMSLFIAGVAFLDPADFAAAKIAVFAASVLSAVAGGAVLWTSGGADA
ncbi:MAG TPA: Na+/H+ antiporter NhaA, partial [Thermoanaerobaculia bacterium]|nr:Na+/H+ antiporter NhaA [Thermoanaerobaculia bacterium]